MFFSFRVAGRPSFPMEITEDRKGEERYVKDDGDGDGVSITSAPWGQSEGEKSRR